MRTERVFSVFWVEAVIAREISCDIEKEGGMTGVAVLVATEAIVLDVDVENMDLDFLGGVDVERINRLPLKCLYS
jgi:hypothetical protein